MLEEIALLIELQKLDNRIDSLNDLLFKMSDEIVEIQHNVSVKKDDYESAKAEFDKIKSEKLLLENEYEQKKNLLSNAQKKLSSVKNSKEYEAVLKELDILKKEINTSEYKILELSDLLETSSKKTEEVADELKGLETLLDEKLKVKEDEDKEKKHELEDIEVARTELSGKIKKQFLSKYETIRKARNNLAIVRIENETCTGCYMKVPPQLYVDVKKNNAVYQCPNCQRFLYFLNNETAEK